MNDEQTQVEEFEAPKAPKAPEAPETLEDQVAALEVKLNAAVNYSSGQDDQLKVQHGKLGLLEAKIARLQTDVMKLRPVAADQAAAATPSPPPPGPPPNKKTKQGVPPPLRSLPPQDLSIKVVPDFSKAMEDVTKRARESLYFPLRPCYDCGHPWNQHSKGAPCLREGCGCREEPKSSPREEKLDSGKRAKLIETEAYEMGVEHGRRLPGDGWTLPNGVELHGHAALGEAYARGAEEGRRREKEERR